MIATAPGLMQGSTGEAKMSTVQTQPVSSALLAPPLHLPQTTAAVASTMPAAAKPVDARAADPAPGAQRDLAEQAAPPLTDVTRSPPPALAAETPAAAVADLRPGPSSGTEPATHPEGEALTPAESTPSPPDVDRAAVAGDAAVPVVPAVVTPSTGLGASWELYGGLGLLLLAGLLVLLLMRRPLHRPQASLISRSMDDEPK
jgi:hypothetical protein